MLREADLLPSSHVEDVALEPAIVEARGVTKVYDTGRVRVHALTDVELTVPRS